MTKNVLLQKILESRLEHHRQAVRDFLSAVDNDPYLAYTATDYDSLWSAAEQLAVHFAPVGTEDILSAAAALWIDFDNQAARTRAESNSTTATRPAASQRSDATRRGLLHWPNEN